MKGSDKDIVVYALLSGVLILAFFELAKRFGVI